MGRASGYRPPFNTRASGDFNPIHLSAISARLFGFPRAIAHGFWNKARTLAELQQHLPAAGPELSVRFQQPLLLPGAVTLQASAPGASGNSACKAAMAPCI